MSPNVFTGLLMAQTDQRLFKLAGEGHERAFEIVVHRHRRALLRYCRSIGLSDSRAEDVMQQALLQAWLSLQRGCEVREPKAWLYRTVHNTAVNVMRSSREEHRPLADGVREHVALAESEFERRLAVRDALDDVAALPQLQRSAILLTALNGSSHAEIASALGVSHGAVRGLLYRARATLRGAAAAVFPAPVIAWAGGLAGRAAPTASRLAELPGAGVSPDTGGMLLKGAVVAASAAALAAGAVIVPMQRHNVHHAKVALSVRGTAKAPAGQIAPARAISVSDLSTTGVSVGRSGSAGTQLVARQVDSHRVSASRPATGSDGAEPSRDLTKPGDSAGGGGEGSDGSSRALAGADGSSTQSPARASGQDDAKGTERPGGDGSHGGGSDPEGSASGGSDGKTATQQVPPVLEGESSRTPSSGEIAMATPAESPH
jgi:RNA polymerase sigma-70 factor (ECF subfamily)